MLYYNIKDVPFSSWVMYGTPYKQNYCSCQKSFARKLILLILLTSSFFWAMQWFQRWKKQSIIAVKNENVEQKMLIFLNFVQPQELNY